MCYHATKILYVLLEQLVSTQLLEMEKTTSYLLDIACYGNCRVTYYENGKGSNKLQEIMYINSKIFIVLPTHTPSI